jgi:hypothetical protein
MITRIPKKALVPLSVGGVLVVLVAVLAYLGLTGGPTQPRPRAVTQASTPLRAAPVVPPPSTPSAGSKQATGTVPGPQGSGTPSAPGPSTASKPTAPPMSQASKPAAGSAPAGKPGPAGTASGGSTRTKPGGAPADPEAAVVGLGQRGRSDPFSPLVVPETQRATPGPALPPPPGVGLPMPPGFATPGAGPSTPPPPPPGAGMRVSGIMGSRQRVAIIEAEGQTYIVGVGERVGEAVVVSILPDKVIMKQNNVTFELGFGGERSS